MNNKKTLAFTHGYGGNAQVLWTEVYVVPPIKGEFYTNPLEERKYRAIWDTGAVYTNISPKVVANLKLSPAGKSDVVTVGGRQEANLYNVGIIIGGGIAISEIQVTELDFSPKADVIVGMDIISRGDFAVTSDEEGKTVLSFRFPTQKEVIDFTEKYRGRSYIRSTKKKRRKS